MRGARAHGREVASRVLRREREELRRQRAAAKRARREARKAERQEPNENTSGSADA